MDLPLPLKKALLESIEEELQSSILCGSDVVPIPFEIVKKLHELLVHDKVEREIQKQQHMADIQKMMAELNYSRPLVAKIADSFEPQIQEAMKEDRFKTLLGGSLTKTFGSLIGSTASIKVEKPKS